jgi:hypothetical protein
VANSSIQVGQNTPFGRSITSAIDKLHEGRSELIEVFAAMEQALDGDPAIESSFATIKVKGGFESDAKAKAGFEEVASLRSKLITDAQIVEMATAITQANAKFVPVNT